MPNRPQTIQIYLPHGDSAGIRVASLTTRTVRVFEIPRTLLSDFLAMPESKQVGVYYLFGGEDSEVRKCYIGQTGAVGERLKQHTKDSAKDYFTTILVAVSLTNEWTSTHVSFLEWLSINRAAQYERYELQNGNTAIQPHTPAPLKADCQEFFETISVLMATLGKPLLEPISTLAVASPGDQGLNTTGGLLFFKDSGCDAKGHLTAEGLVVHAGSKGKYELVPSAPPSVGHRREKLVSEGIISNAGGGLVFLKDHLFSSPSTAAQTLVGGNNNGRTSWKNAEGKNLNDLEALNLEVATPAVGL